MVGSIFFLPYWGGFCAKRNKSKNRGTCRSRTISGKNAEMIIPYEKRGFFRRGVKSNRLFGSYTGGDAAEYCGADWLID